VSFLSRGRTGVTADLFTLRPHVVQGAAMRRTKTRDEREKELQTLLSSPEGREQLEELAARYADASGRGKPERASVITYILVHERQHGLIVG